MVKTIKVRKTDYRNEKEMEKHLSELVTEFRKHTNDLVVESTYRLGELDHAFIFMNWKRDK